MVFIYLLKYPNGTHPKFICSGADLTALVHEASIIALKDRLFNNDISVEAELRIFNS
uniref:FERM domain-containing protein n=1 Tax=Heterorhabditis bacteriophora TaxID=37862 RepID=A0A1I7WXB9_HETBA